jgi:Na+/H+-dicarboxylate symporter
VYLAITTVTHDQPFIQPSRDVDLGLTEEVKGLCITTTSFRTTLVNIIPNYIFNGLVNNQILSIIYFTLLIVFLITRLNE